VDAANWQWLCHSTTISRFIFLQTITDTGHVVSFYWFNQGTFLKMFLLLFVFSVYLYFVYDINNKLNKWRLLPCLFIYEMLLCYWQIRFITTTSN